MTTNQTEAPQPSHDPSGQRTPPRREPTDLGSLRRSIGDRHVAGVAGGLARHFGIDPIIIRVALVVLVFFGGAGVLLYVGAWLLVPEEGTEHAVVRLDDRSRSFLLYVVGGIAALALLGDTIGHFRLPWGLLVAGIVAVLILGNIDRVRVRPRGRSSREGYVPPTPGVYDTPLGTAGASAPEPDAREPGAPDPGHEARADAPTATSYAAPDYAAAYTAGSAQITAEVDEKVRQKVQRYESRRRGPILFWFTVALILVSQGALGIIDLAGANIADAAYPATALGVTGLMLVLGAFWGRAGGLIVLGLLSAITLIGATAADEWGLDAHSRTAVFEPSSSAAVVDTYTHSTGELTVDLSRVSDPAALAGRTIVVTSHVGTIDVIVPDGLTTDATGTVRGPGQVDIFGDGSGGISTTLTGGTTGTVGGSALPLTIDAKLNVGKITVETR